MYRQIFKPTTYNHTIPITIPREWQGQSIEIIAFPVAAPYPEDAPVTDKEFYKLCGAWESDQSAEEMAADLKAARKFRER
ncbi:MAG: hypothetical protein LBF69_07415, partial [Prevotellaceae bacterium]|nr:hypothetical protein [Prevotellaceae bacterium]